MWEQQAIPKRKNHRREIRLKEPALTGELAENCIPLPLSGYQPQRQKYGKMATAIYAATAFLLLISNIAKNGKQQDSP